MLLDSTSPLTIRRSYLGAHRAVADPAACREHAAPGRGDLACARRDPRAGVWRAIGRCCKRAGATDLVQRRGWLILYEIRRQAAARRSPISIFAAAAASGVEELDEGTIRQLVPGLRPGPVWGVMQPDCEHTLDPYRLTVALAEDFVAQGGVIRRGDVRTGITPDGKAQVDDRRRADRFRRAGDRGRCMVAHAAARAWRRRAARYRARLSRDDGEQHRPASSVAVADHKFSLTPMTDGITARRYRGVRRAGGASESKALGHHGAKVARRAAGFEAGDAFDLDGIPAVDAGLAPGDRPFAAPSERLLRLRSRASRPDAWRRDRPDDRRLVAGRPPPSTPTPYRITRF